MSGFMRLVHEDLYCLRFHRSTGRHRVITFHYVVLIIGKARGAERLHIRIAEWNADLVHLVNAFHQRHSDSFLAIYDTSIVFNEVLDNPTKYGFKDADSECQTKECIWNDDLHPTFAFHKLLAEDLATFLASL
jgi:phospholipase/lecithinase/hemolysin